MNIALWALQILLALHTAIGAVWKFTNSTQTVPSLSAIPHSVWLAMGGIELLCSLGLLLPAAIKAWAILIPVAAGFIAAEMLLFTALHLASGDPARGPMIYWLVTAAFCIAIVYGRLAWAPL